MFLLSTRSSFYFGFASLNGNGTGFLEIPPYLHTLASTKSHTATASPFRLPTFPFRLALFSCSSLFSFLVRIHSSFFLFYTSGEVKYKQYMHSKSTFTQRWLPMKQKYTYDKRRYDVKSKVRVEHGGSQVYISNHKIHKAQQTTREKLPSLPFLQILLLFSLVTAAAVVAVSFPSSTTFFYSFRSFCCNILLTLHIYLKNSIATIHREIFAYIKNLHTSHRARCTPYYIHHHRHPWIGVLGKNV